MVKIYFFLFFIVLLLTVRKRLNIFSGISVFLLFLFIANPKYKVRKPGPKKEIAVILDVSKSMSTKDCEGKTRIDVAKRIIKNQMLGLKKYFKIKFFVFGKNFKEVSQKEFFSKNPLDNATAITKNLNRISANISENAVMFLFSDGRNNQSNESFFKNPLVSIGVAGQRQDDAGIKIISYPQDGFKGVPFKVVFSVRKANNLDKVKLRIWEEGKILGEKILEFEENKKNFSVDVTPQQMGKNIKYVFEILPQDSNVSNNSEEFSIPVFKSNFNVLFISGRPGWEYRNLRALIKANPKINLTSFVILRNPTDYIPFPENQLSLIPFPVREIFLKDIKKYDLVIFLNFYYKRFLNENYFSSLCQHIKEGAGLLLIGGEQVFKKGEYYKTPLGSFLPVEDRGTFKEEKFKIVASKTHPVTSTISDILKGSKSFLSGRNEVIIKEKCDVLLKTQRQNPLCLVSEAGKGRVGIILTNGLWRLRFENLECAYFYQEFYRNLIAWLLKSPIMEEISISGRRDYYSGEEIFFTIKVKGFENKKVYTEIHGNNFKEALNPVMKEPGIFEVRERISRQGVFKLVVKVFEKKLLKAKKSFNFKIEKENIEKADLSPDFDFLKKISLETGGKYFYWKDFDIGEFARAEVFAREIFPARSPYFLVLMVVSFGLVWLKDNLK